MKLLRFSPISHTSLTQILITKPYKATEEILRKAKMQSSYVMRPVYEIV